MLYNFVTGGNILLYIMCAGSKRGGREGGGGREGERERGRQVMKYCSAIEAVEVQSEKEVLEVCWYPLSTSLVTRLTTAAGMGENTPATVEQCFQRGQ